MADDLVTTIEITHVLPCLADSSKIRFHALASADLTEVLPYLNAVMQGAVYNHTAPALTYTRGASHHQPASATGDGSEGR